MEATNLAFRWSRFTEYNRDQTTKAAETFHEDDQLRKDLSHYKMLLASD